MRIDPGEYVDCAIWRATGLVLEAPAGEAHMRDRACAGKAIWVISGADVTVENITFSGARVPDQNGAGIRAEGRNLTVRHARFFDNENGILAAAVAGSTISIEGSTFERNGKCAANCAHGIYVDAIARLKIVASTFREQRAGHHIKSAALAFEVSGSTIEDGPEGTASYLIDITSGGEVVIADNQMQKGPNSENWGTAIHIAGEGAPQGSAYRISHNRFRSDNPHEVAFVRNETVVPAVLEGNQLEGTVVALVGPGTVDQKPERRRACARPEEKPAATGAKNPLPDPRRRRSRGEVAPAQAPVRGGADHPGGIHGQEGATAQELLSCGADPGPTHTRRITIIAIPSASGGKLRKSLPWRWRSRSLSGASPRSEVQPFGFGK